MDIVTMARTAREGFARGLGALQTQGIPPQLGAAAEPIAQAMSALHRIESSRGAELAHAGPSALMAARTALSQLQSIPTQHPAVLQAIEAIAGSLGLVHQLSQLAGQASVAPAPATKPSGRLPGRRRNAAAGCRRTIGLGSGPTAREPNRSNPARLPRLRSERSDASAASVAACAAGGPPGYGQPPPQHNFQRTAPAAGGPVTRLRVEAELGAHSATNFYKGLSGNDVIDSGGIFIATYKIPGSVATLIVKVSLPGGYEFEALGGRALDARRAAIRALTARPASARSSRRSPPRHASSSIATCAIASRCSTTICEPRAAALPSARRCVALLRALAARRVRPRARLLREPPAPAIRTRSGITLETPHFRVHYHGGLEPIASKVASVAEDVYERLVPALGFGPDRSHGSRAHRRVERRERLRQRAAVLARTLFVTRPTTCRRSATTTTGSPSSSRTNSRTFCRSTTCPACRRRQQILGPTLHPNQQQPHWIIEGLAVAMETEHTTGGRLRSSQFEMFLRADVLEGNIARLDQISSVPTAGRAASSGTCTARSSSSGSSSIYGPDTFAAVATDYGAQVVPWGINRAIRRATGRTYEELYAGSKADLERRLPPRRRPSNGADCAKDGG